MKFLIVKVVNAPEPLAHADGPGERRTFQLQFVFNVRENVQGRQAVAIQLVDEGDDRCVAQTADFHELLRLRFDAFGAVNHHQRAVHGGEHPVGIFGKVLMPRRVQQVDLAAGVFEFHDRRGDGNAAFFLDGHPVGKRVFRRFPRLDGARHLDGAAEKQQLFRKRCFSRVGMADDPERPAAFNFFLQLFAQNTLIADGNVFNRSPQNSLQPSVFSLYPYILLP